MKLLTAIFATILLIGCTAPPEDDPIEIEIETIVEEVAMSSPYEIILDIPESWGETNWLTDRGGYGTDPDGDLYSFDIYGMHHSLVSTDYNEDGVRIDSPILTITAISKIFKDNPAIPESDEFLTEYEDNAYYVKILTENESHLLEIPDLLSRIKFE